MLQEVTKRLPGKKMADFNFMLRCSVTSALKIFGTKWKPCIICYLIDGPMRYNDLFRIIPNISRKMLSEQLKELETDGIIKRIQYDRKLQRVDYALTEKGISLLPVLKTIESWGLQNVKNVLSIEEMIDSTFGACS